MSARIELSAARRFVLPRTLAEQCVSAIIKRGQEGAELFIALTATVEKDGQSVCFQRGVIPRQTAHTTPHGLLVTIEGEALFELNRDCYEHGEILAGQMHSHPDRAYHSSADDELALVRLPGGISIVVPHFGRGGMAGSSKWSVHQLSAHGAWGQPANGVEVLLS